MVIEDLPAIDLHLGHTRAPKSRVVKVPLSQRSLVPPDGAARCALAGARPEASVLFKDRGLAPGAESIRLTVGYEIMKGLSLRHGGAQCVVGTPRGNPRQLFSAAAGAGGPEEIAREPITHTTRRENDRVEQAVMTLDAMDAPNGSGTTKFEMLATDKRSAEACVDSTAIAAEIEQVMSSLKVLFNDVAGGLDHMGAAHASTSEGIEVDDDEKVNSLQEKLLQYRYVRRIEEPPPPLQELEDLPALAPRPCDKIDANRRPSKLAWYRSAARMQERKAEAAQKAAQALQKRQDALASIDEQGRAKIDEFNQRDPASCPARQERLAELQRRATLRDQRAEEAAQRRGAMSRHMEERATEARAKMQERLDLCSRRKSGPASGQTSGKSSKPKQVPAAGGSVAGQPAEPAEQIEDAQEEGAAFDFDFGGLEASDAVESGLLPKIAELDESTDSANQGAGTASPA